MIVSLATCNGYETWGFYDNNDHIQKECWVVLELGTI
jgi:hypothetical protein